MRYPNEANEVHKSRRVFFTWMSSGLLSAGVILLENINKSSSPWTTPKLENKSYFVTPSLSYGEKKLGLPKSGPAAIFKKLTTDNWPLWA